MADLHRDATGIPRRIALILNPRAASGPKAALWARAESVLAAHGAIAARLETVGDGADGERIAAVVEKARPDIVAAAGGDGTLNAVVHATLGLAITPRPAVAVLPLGTGNDFARSLGLPSIRSRSDLDVALAAMLDGARRTIDVGRVGDRHFGGSFAIGMDADILALRNRLQRRLRLHPQTAGYALYLWSCALSLAAGHGGVARLSIDGVEEVRRLYCGVITNAPIYAGEFRWDGDNDCADGCLDLQLLSGALDYLHRYPQAWRRQVNYRRGRAVRPSPDLRRARVIAIELDVPVAAQVDGEEYGPSRSYRVSVVPCALDVCVPAAPVTTGGE